MRKQNKNRCFDPETLCMKTHVSDVLLLRLIGEAGTLEIWTNREPKTYRAGRVVIGYEGERDAQAIQEFITTGYLRKISAAANCDLFERTPEGVSFIQTFHLHSPSPLPIWSDPESCQ